MTNKLVSALSIFLALMLVSLVSAQEVTYNSPIEGYIYEQIVNYDVYVDYPSENITNVQIALFDSDDNYITGISLSGVNQTQGTFTMPNDGDYYIYSSFLLDESTLVEKRVYFSVNFGIDNPLSISYADPTPENGTLVNSHNINSAAIKAVINKIGNLNLTIYNSTFKDVISYNNAGETNFALSNLYDGLYNFYVEAWFGEASVISPERTVRVKATIPTLSNISVSGLPENINEDVSFSFTASFLPSELPVTVMFLATEKMRQYSFAEMRLENYSGESLTFTSSRGVTEPGAFNAKLMVLDDYGNLKIYSLDNNITVDDVAEPPTTPTGDNAAGGGGRGGGGGRTILVPKLNKTNVTLPENITKEETKESESEVEPEKKSFGSWITGAVIGAFSKPSTAVLTILIIIAIIYIGVRARNYMHSDSGKKQKKNGKSASEEE